MRLANGKTLEAETSSSPRRRRVWNKIAFDPALPATLVPQMGSNVKCLIALRSRFWRAAELAPDCLTDGPVQLTWEGTDSQPGAGAALVAFSGGPAADTCRAWAPGAHRELPDRARAGLHGHSRELRQGRASWTGRPIPG